MPNLILWLTVAVVATAFGTGALVVHFWVRPLEVVRDFQQATLQEVAAAIRARDQQRIDEALQVADQLIAVGRIS